MAHQHYRTKAIFLKKEDRFEADQLFTVFTQDFGKLEVLGRAIRKIKSKLRAGAELFYFSEIEFIQGKNYKTLTDAILVNKFKNLRETPQTLEIAYQVADALDALIGKQERDEKIWHLLNQTLQNLQRSDLGEFRRGLTSVYFLWRLFSILGYAPELFHCASCSKKLLPETFFFVPQEGGVVCWQCFSKLKKEKKQEGGKKENEIIVGKGINVGTVKILRIFLNEPLQIIEKLSIDETDKKNLKEISELYLSFLKETIHP